MSLAPPLEFVSRPWPKTDSSPWPGVDLRAVTVLALSMTLLDAASTWTLLTTGVAVEGNGLLVAIASRYGLEAMLVIRVAFGSALVLMLAGVISYSTARLSSIGTPRQLARRRFDARFSRAAMVMVIAVLGALSIYHVLLLSLTVLGA